MVAAELCFTTAIANQVDGMDRDVTMQTIRSPFGVALVVAVFGIAGMLLVDHGPWNRPHQQTALVNYGTTSAAAKAVGATVTPTAAHNAGASRRPAKMSRRFMSILVAPGSSTLLGRMAKAPFAQ